MPGGGAIPGGAPICGCIMPGAGPPTPRAGPARPAAGPPMPCGAAGRPRPAARPTPGPPAAAGPVFCTRRKVGEGIALTHCVNEGSDLSSEKQKGKNFWFAPPWEEDPLQRARPHSRHGGARDPASSSPHALHLIRWGEEGFRHCRSTGPRAEKHASESIGSPPLPFLAGILRYSSQSPSTMFMCRSKDMKRPT